MASFSGLQISASRRHVTMVLAIDTSLSMSTRHHGRMRLETAVDGSKTVLDALHDGDHVSLLSFANNVRQESNGLECLDYSKRHMLHAKLRQLRAGGTTALYDTILQGSKHVLEMSAALNLLGQGAGADAGTFWFILLTDGEDTSSTHRRRDAEQVLRKLNAELGTRLMKMIIIGIKLGSTEKKKLTALAKAGGDMVRFVDAQQLADVTSCFDDIAVQVSEFHIRHSPSPAEQVVEALRARVEELGAADDDEEWVGAIQKGSHVRCVGASYGEGKVSIGDVGVVASRDSIDQIRVNFRAQDNWIARPSDLALDPEAEKVRPGAVVTVKAGLGTLLFGQGIFKTGMHGLVHKVEGDGCVYVNFGIDPHGKPSDNLWKGLLQELRCVNPSDGPWAGKLQLGQAVRVPSRLHEPSTGWGNLKRDEVGYVRAKFVSRDSQLRYVCDFPSADKWLGRADDLEVDAIADRVRPGKQVRVREGVQPSRGFGNQTRASVGTVKSVSYDGSTVVVKFPGNPRWMGKLGELETTDRPPTHRAVPVGTTPNCLGGHGLTPTHTKADNQKVCDFCGEGSGRAGTLLYTCTKCDTDACERCYQKSKAAPHPDDTARPPVAGRPVCGASSVPMGVPVAEVPVASPPSTASSRFAVGQSVRIHGLNSSPALNGKLARVVSLDSQSPRYHVQLPGADKIYLIQAANLADAATLREGTLIKLQGIESQQELNGCVGAIVGYDAASGRYTARLLVDSSERMVKVVPERLVVLPGAEELS